MTLATIIDATADAVTRDTANAAALFRASGSLTTGVATQVAAGRHTFVIDEPPALGGEDAAPTRWSSRSPASCRARSSPIGSGRTSFGVAVDGIDVSAEGDLDVRGIFGLHEGVRAGFGAVRVTVRIAGPEPEERYRELKAAVDAHCPVLDLFVNPTQVTTALEVAAPVP